MDKIVFRKYMNKEIRQKSLIFASVFGITIKDWHTANE